MEIVINHLTRMGPGRICVAGIDIATKKHVRPIPLGGTVSTTALARNGGPFDIANVVYLQNAQACPQRPKLEDHSYELATKLRLGKAAPFFRLLTEVAETDLEAIFGPSLVMHNSGAYLAPSTGNASLGCLTPASPPFLYCTTYGAKTKLRISVATHFGNGNAVNLDLSVTDIRMYLPDFATPNESLVSGFNKRMQSENLVLGIGVGYPYQTSQTSQAVHWLQVNALHFESDPDRQLN